MIEEDLTCEEAGERVGLGGNTIRRAWKASLAGAEGGAVVVDAPAGSGLEVAEGAGPVRPLPAEVLGALSVADPDKARAIRRLVVGEGGTYDAATVEGLALAWGCSAGDVRALIIGAAIEAGKNVLPPELATAESLATLRDIRRRAKNAADFKSELMAQAAIDQIQLPPRGKGAPGPDQITRAQVAMVLGHVLEAVTPFGARAAAEKAIAEATGG